MQDVTELYDDLVALRRAQWITGENLGDHIERTEGLLRAELDVLSEDELEETFESLTEFYDESARVELEELLR